MLKFSILSTFILFVFLGHGQLTIFDNDFESGSAGWATTGNPTPNFWMFNSCAGNGPSLPGTNSMYITIGGAVPGCGGTGMEQYAYADSPSGSQSTISYTSIDGSCVTNLTIDFDYKIDGDFTNDYAELVYSDDGGTSWIPIGSALAISPGWTNYSGTLPAILDGTMFELGFRFTYDDAAVIGVPLAIDNLTISGTDNIDPTVVCPAVIPLYVNGSCQENIIDYASLALVADNCLGVVTVVQTPPIGTLVDISSSVTIILTGTDPSGNQSQCSFVQTIFDTISPSITCPGNQTIYLDASCGASILDYTGLAVFADNCDGFATVTLTQSPPPSSIIGADANIILTAEDGYSNTSSCSFTLQALDTISPTVSCPSDSVVGTDVACENTLSDFTGSAVGDDNCTSPVSLLYSQSPPPGTLIPLGTQIVTITVEDESGNTNNCNFTVTVEDQTNPVIDICPSNQTVESDANCEGMLADYSTLLSASDNCSVPGNLIVSQSPGVGAMIFSDTLVIMTVTDENGNSINCQFTAFLSDTLNPSVNCPSNFTMTIDASCQYTIPDITGSVTGSDNCSSFSSMTIVQSPAPSSIGSGITPVFITLSDEQGNSTTCITTIAPIDTIPPTINCPNPSQVDLGTGCTYVLPNYGSMAMVLDNCPDYFINQTPVPNTVVGPGLTSITIQVQDAGGNIASCSFVLSVIETQSPTIVCPPNISTCDPVVNYANPIFNDNCFSYLTQTDITGLTSGSTFPIGITTLEYTVLDSSANSQTCTFDVEILDYPSSANILEDTILLCDQITTNVNADPITSGSGLWTVSSGQGNFNNQFANSTGVNNLIYGTNVFVWTVSSASCGSLMDSVVVISSQTPLPASISQDTLLACEQTSINLTAASPLFGIGVWQSNSTAIILDSTANITTATINNSGWSTFIWTVENGSCQSSSDTLYVISNLKPAIVTQDTSICIETEIVVLVGSIPNAEQSVLWSIISGEAFINTPTNYSTQVSYLDLNINQFQYSVSHPLCPTQSDSVYVITTLCEGFNPSIPTMITPNFDGKNDVFVIPFIETLYPDCHVTIFNRWGSIVFESHGYEIPWDGTYKNEPLPMGTYFYKIELNDDSNTIYNGDISIIH